MEVPGLHRFKNDIRFSENLLTGRLALSGKDRVALP